MVETHWKVTLDYLEKMISGILFAEVCKLSLAHDKALQENKQLKTDKVEKNKHFKAHNFKIG